MSKQTEQQDETCDQVLKVSAPEPNTTEKCSTEPDMILNYDMPQEIDGMSRRQLFEHLKKFEM